MFYNNLLELREQSEAMLRAKNTLEQSLEQLRMLKCDIAQGFYLARPAGAPNDRTLALAVNVGDRTPQPLYRESNYENNYAEIRVEIRGSTARPCAGGSRSTPTGTG